MPGLWEILILVCVACFIFGARKPEEIARVSGKLFRTFQQLKGKLSVWGRFFKK